MKKSYKIYLEPEDYARLEIKAVELFKTKRGSVSKYIQKISREPVVFLDSNLRAMLEILKLKPDDKGI